MITIKNYNEQKDQINWSNLPKQITDNRKDVEEIMEFYNDDADIKETVDLFLKGINDNAKPTIKEIADNSNGRIMIGKIPSIKFVEPKPNYTSLLSNYRFAPNHPLMVLDKNSPQFKKAFEEFLLEANKYGDKSKNGDWELIKKPTKPKTVKPAISLIQDLMGNYLPTILELTNLDLPENQNTDSFKNAYQKVEKELINNWEDYKDELEEEIKSLIKKPTKPKIVKPTIQKNFVDNYSIEFTLIKRFWNIVDDGVAVVPFRKIQLLFNAFNKAALERKIRKTNDVADLFTKCSQKITKLYNEFAAPGKKDVKVELTDKNLYNEIEKYCKNVAINPAVAVLKRYISIQNTSPDIKKASAILKSINNIFENDKNNRLYNEIKMAKINLSDYISGRDKIIDVQDFGLSRPASSQKVCHNRVKCAGLTKDGKLRPGYKFREDTNEVIRVPKQSVAKRKPTTKRKPIAKKKRVVGLGYSENDEIEHIFANPNSPIPVFNNLTKQNIVDQPAPEPPTETQGILQVPADAQPMPMLVKNKLMNMQFDSLEMDEGWETFMQNPAKNLKIGISGKPKNGKTAGSLQLANYLTKFGNVLYNFADQGFNKSTQDLWLISGLANNPKAEPTDVTTLEDLDKLCKSGKYSFVFIDMINDYIDREKITPQEFKDRFILKYPKMGFVLIFEVTKAGEFKGDQKWMHVVDAIAEVSDFLMEIRGRYGMGHHIIWDEGFKRYNPKKYAEIQSLELQNVEVI